MFPAWGRHKEITIKDQDIMEKRRLASRTFGFLRHQVYRTKALVEPLPDTPHYASDEDRLDKNFDASLKHDHERKICKAKELRSLRAGRNSSRQQRVLADRDKEWQVKQEHEYNLLTVPRPPNKGGEAYNLITMEYDDGYEGRQLKYMDDAKRWRDGMRRLRIQNKMSGNRNFNVINWEKTRPMDVPPRPAPLSEHVETEPPRPQTVPEPTGPPVIAPEVARPVVSARTRSDASENCPWELERYLYKPYTVK